MSRLSRVRPSLIAALAALSALPALAQPRTALPADRPTVGLVLSGGSAKGLAHVGAIRAIEAAGIPVDVVTGTSMGSIVGGLYAMGYPVDTLDDLVRRRDWTELFDDAVARREEAPEARLGEGATLVSLPIEDGRVGLPSGLVDGQEIFDFLAGLLWPAQGVRDFRTLPRPFAAVVVDAQSGAPVRLDAGYLPLAIRASMSLPSLFEPVEIDGRRYLDGGLARNLPAEDAVALGADVLVCVDVSEVSDTDAAGTDSFFDVLVNAAFYQSDRDLEAQRALCDVLILPDTEGLTSAAFGAGAEWIARGEAAGASQRAALDSLAAALGTPGLGSPPAPPEGHTVRAEAIAIRGVDGQAEALIRRRLKLELPAALSAEEVEQAVQRVYATGVFALLTYRVVGAGEDGAATVGGRSVPTLVLDVRPSNGDRVGFGFRYDDHYNAALLFTLRLRDVGLFGSTSQVDVRLGEQTQLRASYFGRFGVEAPLAAAAVAGYSSVPVQVFAGRDRASVSAALEVLDARAFAGPILFNTVITGVGPGVAHVRASPEVAPDSVETTRWTYGALSAFAAVDTRDRVAFPSRGARLLATAAWSPGAGASFRHVTVNAERWIPLSPAVSLGTRVAATRAWGDDVPLDHVSFVGGDIVPALGANQFFALYGAEALELVGTASQVAALSAQAELRPDLFVRATVNAGRAGDGWTVDPDAYRTGLGVTLGTGTPIGPVELTLSTSDLGDTPQFAFSLGRAF